MPFHYPQNFSVKTSNCLGLQYPEKRSDFLEQMFPTKYFAHPYYFVWKANKQQF